MKVWDQVRKHIPGLIIKLFLVVLTVLSVVLLVQALAESPSESASSNKFGVAALSVALLSVFITVNTWTSDRQRQISNMYRLRVVNGWNEAQEILNKSGHDRVKWLAATRIIELCNRLREKVSEQVDIDSLTIEVNTIREKLWHLLEKSATFYLGRPDCTRLADADKEEQQNGYSKEIPLYAINAIYSLIQYPKPYVDPLEKNKEYTLNDFSGLSRESDGLKKYISYRQKRKE